MEIKAIILGADKKNSLQSGLPRILQPICGTPMIEFLINSVEEAGIINITVVVSPETDAIKPLITPHETVIQPNPSGTGDAVLRAKKVLKPFNGCVMILYGDSPLIRPETIQKMIDKYKKGTDVVALGFIPSDARRYGRLVMDNKGLKKIVEYKEANDEQRTIRLCNAGAMCINGQYVLDLLKKINNDNNAGEYYLTDIVEIARNQGLKTDLVIGDVEELHGINSQEELEAAEELFLKCHIRREK